MNFELYLQNIKNLYSSMGRCKPIELDEALGVTFISNSPKPSFITISFDLEEDTMQIETLIATKMPISRIGIQSVMNQLIGDFLTHNKSLGRLVAQPEKGVIKYIKTVDLKTAHAMTLTEIMPQFISESVKWRNKFFKVIPQNLSRTKHQAQEIVSFKYP